MKTSYKYAIGAISLLLLIFAGYKLYNSPIIPAATDAIAGIEKQAQDLFNGYIADFSQANSNISGAASTAINEKLAATKTALSALGYNVINKVGTNTPYGLTLVKKA